jgi:hypothetical protein
MKNSTDTKDSKNGNNTKKIIAAIILIMSIGVAIFLTRTSLGA